MKNLKIVALFLCPFSAWCQVDKAVQDAAIERYLGSPTLPLAQKFAQWDQVAPGNRPTALTDVSLHSLLPTGRPFAFVAYIMDTRYNRSAALSSFAQQVVQGQMNKMTTGVAGGSGTTSLLASSVAPDIFSLATEYGAINQTTTGNTTTMRGNLAGIAGLFVGDPYLGCPSLAVASVTPGGCSGVSRLARGFSSSISVDTSANPGATTVSGTNAATGTPATTNILAAGNRMTAWNVRYDFQRKTVYDSKMVQGFAAKWAAKMAEIAQSSTEATLDSTMVAVLNDIKGGDAWEKNFVDALQQAPTGGLQGVLQQQLDTMIGVIASQDPQFMSKVQQAQNAIQASFLQRDEALSELQSNRFSLAFEALHPAGLPNLSNLRLIYSYQPTKGPLLLTFNFAGEWYDSAPLGTSGGRFRDVQAAAQVDRQFNAAQLGPAVLTVAFYYQWMREAAAISIAAGNTVPGTGIVLPAAASTLLASKGPIDIGQVKLTFPIKNGALKVPISFTWSNRTELINESEKRGQVGLTLDLDSLFQQ